MSLKYILFILLTFAAINASAQIFINADSNQIKKEMRLRSAGLYKNFVEKDIETRGYYRKMVFRFPSPPEGNACLMRITFFFTHQGKCFKYYESYWGRGLLEDTIKRFDKHANGLNRVKGCLRWVSPDGKFEASIDSQRVGNSEIYSVYNLKIKNLLP